MGKAVRNFGYPVIFVFSLLAFLNAVPYAGAVALSVTGVSNAFVNIGGSVSLSANVVGGTAPYTANWVWSNTILGIAFSTPPQPVRAVGAFNTSTLNFTALFPGALVNTYNSIQYSTPVAPPNSISGNWVFTTFVRDSAGAVVSTSNVVDVYGAMMPPSPVATSTSTAKGLSTTVSVLPTGGSGSYNINWLYTAPGSGSPRSIAGDPIFSASTNVVTMTANSISPPGVYTVSAKITDAATGFSIYGMPALIILHPGAVACYSSANIVLAPCSLPFQEGAAQDIGQPVDVTPTVVIANTVTYPVAGPYLANVIWNSTGGPYGSQFFNGNTPEVSIAYPTNNFVLTINAFATNSIEIKINNNIFFANTINPNNNIYGAFTFNLIVTDSGTNPSNVAFAVNTITFGAALTSPFAVHITPTVFQFGNVISISANAVGGTAPYLFKMQVFNSISGLKFNPPGPQPPAFVSSGPNFTFNATHMPPLPPGTYFGNMIVTDATGAAYAVNTLNSAVITVPNFMTFNSVSSNTAIAQTFTFYNRPEILNFANTGIKINFTTTNNTIFSGSVSISNGSVTALGVSRPSGFFQVFAPTNITLPGNYTLQASVNMSYPCSVPASSVVPYELPSNNVWTPLTGYTVNSVGCYVTINSIPKDPVISILSTQSSGGGGGGGGGGSTTSTASSTTSASTTTTVPAATTTIRNRNITTNSTHVNLMLNLSSNSTTVNLDNGHIMLSLFASHNGAANVIIKKLNFTSVPAPPSNFIVEDAVNFSVNGTASSKPVTANLTLMYNCSVPSSRVYPYIFVNGAWKAVVPFSVNAGACTVKFAVPTDPIAAIMQYQPVYTTTSTISSTTTTGTGGSSAPSQGSSTLYWIVGIAIVIIVAVGYAMMRKKR